MKSQFKKKPFNDVRQASFALFAFALFSAKAAAASLIWAGATTGTWDASSANRIVKSRMAAVLISPEFYWMEAGSSSDVIVKDNFIEGCLQTPIQILANGGTFKTLPVGTHRNISILGNRMIDCSWPLIRATSTSGLIIKDNEFSEAPPVWQLASSSDGSPVAIKLEQCEDVTPDSLRSR